MIMMMMRSEIKDHFRAPLKHHTKDKIKQKNNCEETFIEHAHSKADKMMRNCVKRNLK